jgi:bifunctional DNA-binding transcriptional regulator/antitoxin component of YhaV-PrlF toxin-antitoxin module
MFYKAKISKGGKVSIPIVCRKYLKISEGEEIIFKIADNQVTISPLKATLQKVRDMVNKYHDSNESLVEQLLLERKKDLKNE